MSKITDRREKTAHTNIENKAVLADSTKPKSDFPYKKILIIVLAIVAVVACILLVVNAFVDSYAGKLATGKEHTNAVATVEVKGDLYENTADYLANPSFSNAFYAAAANHAKNYANVKANENVYNFLVAINSPETDAETANLSVVMLLSINKAEEKVTYFAINKAMLVQIPTVGVGPLYDAYGFGEAALLARTVQDNFGVKVDGYVDMPLKSFVDTANDLGGIVIDDPTLTDDERKLDTDAEIYNYVKYAVDRNAAMTNVVTALANKAKDAGVFGMKGIIDKIAESLDANISRDNFGDLVNGGTKMFENEGKVCQIGYATSSAVTKKVHGDGWQEPYEEFATVNYEYEVTLLHSLMFPVVEEAK
ncbi:MAG: LCP family protein [Clostridia bacterium]|nr:LCP family protein [Clostridia bacterium]